MEKVLAYIDDNLEANIARLFELLRIPSISTDPSYSDEMHRAAKWLVDDLNALGFNAQTYATTGYPMVIGKYMHADPSKPHLMFYGHYDVQPADPVDEWDSPAFEPVLKDLGQGRKIIVGRGAVDDKGQIMTFIEACRAFMSVNGELPCSITIFIEGEEESSSKSMPGFLDKHGDVINADIALVCDTLMLNRETPAITTALRGMMYDEVKLICANIDLHSGIYGGAARNPIHLLTHILSQLHDENGAVTLDNFYDDVPDFPKDVLDQWNNSGFDAESFLGNIGLSEAIGETDRSVLERIWARPTLDVNGIWGGYMGEGSKTVIPSEANAKISCRLVGGQDPDRIRESLREFITKRIPADCEAVFTTHGQGAPVMLPFDLAELKAAQAALTEEWGKDAALIAMGGSIPVIAEFKKRFGMETLMIGFGLEDDGMHAPNEKYELSSYHKGIRSWARIIDRLVRLS